MSHVDCPGSCGPLSLAAMSRRVTEISTLPYIAVRVIQVANDPNSGVPEIKSVLEADPALSARILRCVNSSAYAVQTKIANLQQAIAYLGVKQISNLVLTASVSSLFQNDVQIGTYKRKQLWRHMVAVGVCARMIARRTRLRQFEEVFLAGLLHDLGIILEDQHAHGSFVEVMRSVGAGKTLLEAERQHLGFDHALLGAQVAQQWKLPNGVTDTVRYHHNSAACQGKYRGTVWCVDLANYLCSVKGQSAIGRPVVEFPDHSTSALGLGEEDLVVLAEDLDRELETNHTLFQL